MEQEAAAIIVASASAAADFEGRCRLCFSGEDLTCSLFPPEGEPSREVIEMILDCTSIRITLAEDYPSKVCEKCLETLDKFYHYRQRCLQNDKILKSQRAAKAKQTAAAVAQERPVQVIKQEPEQVDDHHQQQDMPLSAADAQEPSDQQQHAQSIKQEDPGGCSSILRSILLQSRGESGGRATSTASAEHEPEQENLAADAPQPDEEEDHKEQLSLATKDEPQLPPSQASLLQQMLLQQQGFSSRETHSPASLAGASPLQDSPSLLKRMLLEGGGSNQQDRQSPLEGPSTLNHRSSASAEDHQPPMNHHHPHLHHQHQHHDENHNEEHSETPLASQLRAILLQHRAAAAAAAVAAAASTSTGMMMTTMTTTTSSLATSGNSTTTTHEQHQQTQQQQQQQPPEKPEVSYLRSLFLRNDSDGNDGESDTEVTVDPNEQANREMLFSMFQELQARNEQNSDDTDDSEDRAFDYRIPSVRRRSSESTESRKRRRLDFTCLLCGRPFLNRSKLVLHMRTHISGPESTPPPSTVASQNSNAAAAAAAAAALTGSGPAASAAAVAAAAAAALAAGSGASSQLHGDVAGTAGNAAEDDEESRQIELLERRSYACYICGADQNNLQQLKEHLLLAHQDRIRSRGRAKERPKPLINCNFCSRQFRSQFAYGEHLRTHTGERPFPCDQCDKRFPRRFQLLGHLYNVHKQSWVADESKAKFVKK